MCASWTTDQITALAPDAASLKAGKGLATPGKWETLGHNERAVWGECRGSAATPYQTRIDLEGPAFRCSWLPAPGSWPRRRSRPVAPSARSQEPGAGSPRRPVAEVAPSQKSPRRVGR